MSDESTTILDLAPALLARKRSECEHPTATISDDSASLTCSECGAELDPWWFLRRLAHNEEVERARIEQYAQLEIAAHEHYRAVCDSLNAKITAHTEEVNRLIAVKNRLWNERDPVSGQPIGSLSTRRRRSVATGKPSPKG